MHQLTINNITIDVVRKNIKNMHLAVYPPSGRVRIAVPEHVNDEAVRLFAISKLSWIKRHQRKYINQERLAPLVYKERESHYFLGQRLLLRIKETTGKAKAVMPGKTYLDVYIKKGTDEEGIQKLIEAWYRIELKKILPDLIDYWQQKIGVSCTSWGVKKMKTKWGSCNTEQKRIWLNLELAKKPTHCIEYIVVHELVHLIERHHNDRFQALMDQYLPGWQRLRDELNRLPVSHAEWEY